MTRDRLELDLIRLVTRYKRALEKGIRVTNTRLGTSYTPIKKIENTLDLYPSQQQLTKTKSPFENNKINRIFAPAFNR